MPYTPRPFDYSLRPYDAVDLSVETADILDVRDNQLTNYLQTETAAIQSEINSIVQAPGDWQTYVPVLKRGTTTVTTTTSHGYFCASPRICLVNIEIQVSTSTSWTGDEIVSVSLPTTARAATRILGTAMFNKSSVFYHCLAFLPGTNDDVVAYFLPSGGQPWLGQTVTGNPTLSGNMQGSNLYMNLVYYPVY